MLVEKSNLLQRVRVVMIALVAIIGFGTMAMKPAERLAAHTYGVAETAGGTNWEIQANVTGLNDLDYSCIAAPNNPVCTITINSEPALDPGDLVPVNTSLIKQRGRFGL